MKRLDLSSVGWEYVEIRGRRFEDLLAVQLRLIPKMAAVNKAVPLRAEELLRMHFVQRRHIFERRITAEGATPHLTNRELKTLFPMFEKETMLIEGEPNRFEPDGGGISFTTHHRIAVNEAMCAPDSETGKPAGALDENEFKALVAKRTVPLSQIRRLHKFFDPDGRFGETAVMSAMAQINAAMTEDIKVADEIAIFAVDGKNLNPPIRVVFDDALHKPSVFSDQLAYKNALGQFGVAVPDPQDNVRAVVSSRMLNMGFEAIRKDNAEQAAALPGSIPAEKLVIPKSPLASQRPSFSGAAKQLATNSSKIEVKMEPAPESPKINVGEFLEGSAMQSKTTPSSAPEQASFVAGHPVVQETRMNVSQMVADIEMSEGSMRSTDSVFDWIRQIPLMSMRFNDIKAKIQSTYKDFATKNPQVDFDLYSRAARLFIREQSLRILAGQLQARINKVETEVGVDEPVFDPLFEESFEMPSALSGTSRTTPEVKSRSTLANESQSSSRPSFEAHSGPAISDRQAQAPARPNFSAAAPVPVKSSRPSFGSAQQGGANPIPATGHGDRVTASETPPAPNQGRPEPKVVDVTKLSADESFDFTLEGPVEAAPGPAPLPSRVATKGGFLSALKGSREIATPSEIPSI